MNKALLVFAIAVILCSEASAASKWWDIDGAGAGTATPTGNWNTATANWTTDSTGGSAGTTWANGDAAIFSAGTNVATGVFTVTTTAAQSASSILVEEGTVQHAGTSTNTLTTPSLTINSGATFSVSTALSFTPPAASTLTLNGGTIQNRNGGVGSSFLSSGSANTNMGIVLGTGGGRVSVTGASTAVSIYTGLISGTGPLFIDGTNNATFRLTTTPATYSGGTTITNGGKLQISTTANVLPAATDLTINTGGIFDFQTSQSIASLSGGGNMIGSNPAAVLTITGASSTVYSGIWSGTTNRINVNKSGGTLTLSGVNTATGRFTLTNGNVDVASTGSIGGSVMDLHVDGGTLTLNQAAESVENLVGAGGSIVLNNAALSLVVDPIATVTSASVISGAGGLTKVNVISGATVRTQVLAGANTYTGGTTISGGILQFANTTAMPASGGVTVLTGSPVTATLAVNAGGAGEWTDGTSGGGTIGGLIAGVGGQGTVDQVTWNANSAMGIDTTSGSVSYGGVVGSFRSGPSTTRDDVGVNKLGTNTLTLTAANTYTGGTTATAGTLAIGNDSALGTGALTFAGGTVSASGGARTIANNAVLAANGTVGGADALTINGTFTNSGGNRILSSTNTATTTLAGPVYLSEATGTGRTLTFAGVTTNNPVFVVSGNIANFSGGSGTAGNVIVGGGAGATGAIVTLSGTNTHTGNTTLNTASTLKIGSSGAFGGGTFVVGGNGTFDNTTGAALVLTTNMNQSGGSPTFTGTDDLTIGNVALSGGNRTITVSSKTLSVNNVTQDSARNYTKAGAGTLVVRGTDSHSGTTPINGGIWHLASTGNMTATSSVTVATGAKLVVDGTISSTGAVTINSGGTLAGTGSIAGPVTVSGTLSPGNSIESLGVGALTFSGTSTFVYEVDSTYNVSLAAAADLVNANGNLLIASTAMLNLVDIGTPINVVQPGTKFTLISYAGTWDNGTFAGRPDDCAGFDWR